MTGRRVKGVDPTNKYVCLKSKRPKPKSNHPILRQFSMLQRQNELTCAYVSIKAGYSGTAMDNWGGYNKSVPKVATVDDMAYIFGYQLRLVPIEIAAAIDKNVEAYWNAIEQEENGK